MSITGPAENAITEPTDVGVIGMVFMGSKLARNFASTATPLPCSTGRLGGHAR